MSQCLGVYQLTINWHCTRCFSFCARHFDMARHWELQHCYRAFGNSSVGVEWLEGNYSEIMNMLGDRVVLAGRSCCPTQSKNHSTNVLQSLIFACGPASDKMEPPSKNPASFKSHPWCCEGESHVCLACSIEVGTKVRPCTTLSEASSYSCRNSLGPRHSMFFHSPNMETSTSARTHFFALL